MAERFENLEKAMCKELEKLDKRYTADVEMSAQDAERADMLWHALKSAETYYAMKDAENEDMEDEYSGAGRSYRNGGIRSGMPRRNVRTGRFMSRDGGGYGGFSGEYSGWYPMDQMWDRRY